MELPPGAKELSACHSLMGRIPSYQSHVSCVTGAQKRRSDTGDALNQGLFVETEVSGTSFITVIFGT